MKPKVIVHIGCSLDGRIDWLKPDQFLYYRVIRDWAIDAMLSGSNTILAAEMDLSPRIEKLEDQYLVVVDSGGRIMGWDVIKRQAWWNDTPIVLCSKVTPQSYLDGLRTQGVHSLVYGEEQVDLAAALTALYDRFGIRTIRMDSGGILAGLLLRQGLVDAVSVLISPQLTGGCSLKSIFVAEDLTSLDGVVDLKLVRQAVLEEDYVHLYYEVIKGGDLV
jgi:2,5-diamino-6-(ribosylamino)-4(3H)-pyrimidinone 5'-phosphate reductase